MLALDQISFSYGAVQALRGVSMAVEPGKITCVMGRNGVGKTTLIKNIAGVLRPNSGTIQLGAQAIARLPSHKRAKAGIAWVPQGRMIFPKLTVEENLRVGLEARTDGRKTIPDEIYELFPVLKQMSKRMGGDLSGGQQQQLAIGRALVGEPKVLLLDEPTEGIQPNVIQQIGHVLRKLVQRGMAIALVEQYLDFVREFGNSFHIMNRGRVVASGDVAQLTPAVVDSYLGV
jgi:urea transport system ATP-binding protein